MKRVKQLEKFLFQFGEIRRVIGFYRGGQESTTKITVPGYLAELDKHVRKLTEAVNLLIDNKK